MKEYQKNSIGHSWWTTRLYSEDTAKHVACHSISISDYDEILFRHPTIVVVTHTDNWAFVIGWVVASVAHWCRDNCKSAWHLGTMEHVYFQDPDEAVLFMMTHTA